MIEFLFNNEHIRTDKPPGMSLLDFIRNESHLKGTKIGCREGDCGACVVTEGTLKKKTIEYRTIVSCLTPLANVIGKHIVTIEGLNLEKPSPVQAALIAHNGTQCGFCTPGFVVSLTSFLLSDQTGIEAAIDSIDGNICRCTGYKSIERAADEVHKLKLKCPTVHRIEWLVKEGYLPGYFSSIYEKLKNIKQEHQSIPNVKIMGGGTDLMVQQPDELNEMLIHSLFNQQDWKTIENHDGYCTIGSEATADNIMNSTMMQQHFPNLRKHFKLISSTPIRNMGTLAGNIVNASPIGDLSIFFLALDADVFIVDAARNRRKQSLRNFFLDYKKLDLRENELIEKIGFRLPDRQTQFNFEKVSKRTYLDIASVNTALLLRVENELIREAHLSAGGVSPVPLYLHRTSAFLTGNAVNCDTISEAVKIAQGEISPISDIRGSETYKRLLLRQLIVAHFITLFPEKFSTKEVFEKLLT